MGVAEKRVPSSAEEMNTPAKIAVPEIVAVDPWEAAYLRFETPEQEIQKFRDRLVKLGARDWDRQSEIVELFCGRGNGLHALEQLGFKRIEGVDLSAALVAKYSGPAKVTVADCRQLPFANASKDVLIVQGGLHHLPVLPDDLDRTLAEMRRVLRPDGRVVLVEPWLTPFLRMAHRACGSAVARRLSGKVDALAVMIEHERRTYEQWLNQPDVVLSVVRKHFVTKKQQIGWGKWTFVGQALACPLLV